MDDYFYVAVEVDKVLHTWMVNRCVRKDEALISGPQTEEEAIEQAVDRGSWA